MPNMWQCAMLLLSHTLSGRIRALPQAGQGQDYVEGCNNKTYICYKCHMPGHWARDCPGEPADGQVRTVLEHSVSCVP